MKKQEKFFAVIFVICFLVCEVVLAKEYFYEKIVQWVGIQASQDAPLQTEEVIQSEITEVSVKQETETKQDTETVKKKEFQTVGYDYFEDALLIGDSRMEGIKEYGGLENTDFFAHSGMSVFSIGERKLTVHGEKMTFAEVLEHKQYKKVYFMIGINELGYQFDLVEKKYAQRVEQIKEAQPNAIIYLCANLHVTKEQSDKDSIYNNENVNRLNTMVKALTDGERVIYLDINELFDDEDGALSKEYSADSFHVMGKYYEAWVDWLCTKAIVL